VLLDQNGNITHLNQTTEGALGYPADQLLMRNFFDTIGATSKTRPPEEPSPDIGAGKKKKKKVTSASSAYQEKLNQMLMSDDVNGILSLKTTMAKKSNPKVSILIYNSS
jgi:hypothetical protein